MIVRFWGVRGSISCAGRETLGYGGNTSCVEIRCGDHLVVMDGGTGIRGLGHSIGHKTLRGDILFSHTHYDHILGLPFFGPLFNPSNAFRLWAGHLGPQSGIEDVLRTMMTSPLFPVPVDVFSADVVFRDFAPGDVLDLGEGIAVRTAALNHPNGATGYRVEFNGRSVCYVTDTEHTPGTLDRNIVDLISGADMFIYDATYTDEEYPGFKGWGHSTWEEGARLAAAAGVKTYVIFHHDPAHDDHFMDRVAAEAARAHPGAIVAREGLALVP